MTKIAEDKCPFCRSKEKGLRYSPICPKCKRDIRFLQEAIIDEKKADDGSNDRERMELYLFAINSFNHVFLLYNNERHTSSKKMDINIWKTNIMRILSKYYKACLKSHNLQSMQKTLTIFKGLYNEMKSADKIVIKEIIYDIEMNLNEMKNNKMEKVEITEEKLKEIFPKMSLGEQININSRKLLFEAHKDIIREKTKKIQGKTDYSILEHVLKEKDKKKRVFNRPISIKGLIRGLEEIGNINYDNNKKALKEITRRPFIKEIPEVRIDVVDSKTNEAGDSIPDDHVQAIEEMKPMRKEQMSITDKEEIEKKEGKRQKDDYDPKKKIKPFNISDMVYLD